MTPGTDGTGVGAPSADAPPMVDGGLGSRRQNAENFPVALKILPRGRRDELWALYRYARYIDTLGDEADGDRVAQLDVAADQVRSLAAGSARTAPPIAGLRQLVRTGRIPEEPLLALIAANHRDQLQHRYQSYAQLLDYCALSANPVGLLVLHVFDSVNRRRIDWSDRVCTGLQLVEHLQDVGEDYRAGRIYLPLDDLLMFDVPESDLGERVASPRLRALIAFELDRAAALLDAGAPLVADLRGWARLAVSLYLAGGRAAVARLRAHHYDPLPGPPKPAARHVVAQWLRQLSLARLFLISLEHR